MRYSRGWTLAGAAVILPLAALCWMQYRSLDELESKTRAVVRDELRGKLELVRQNLEKRIEAIAAAALAGVEQNNAEATLAAARARMPEIDQAFFVSRCDRKSAAAGPETCALIEAFKAARPLRRFEYFQYQPRAGARCESCHQRTWIRQHESAVYVFRAAAGSDQLAGIRIRSQVIAQRLLPESIAAVQGSRADPPWKASFADTPAANDDQIAIHGGAILPLWHLVGEYEGSTIHSLARSQQRRSLWLWSFLFACLLAGIGFTMRAAAREAQLAEMKSAFVSNISHEMKTPLAAIRAFAETLQLGRVKDAARMQQYFGAIHHESLRLTELIDNVLDLARQEAARGRAKFELADAGRIVESVCEASRERILAAGFRMSVRIDRPLEPIRADAGALSTALQNLLSNAEKYSGDSRRIEVRVWQERSSVHIAVSDDGIGIAPQDQGRIFERFYRAGDPLVHGVKGAGLGLALAKEIADAHGGVIEVASRPGQGSTFTISLPLAMRSAVAPEAPLAEAAHR